MHESAIHVCFCHEEKNAKCMHNMCENDLARVRQLPQWFEWIPFKHQCYGDLRHCFLSVTWYDLNLFYFPLICSNHLLCDIVEHSSSAFSWDARGPQLPLLKMNSCCNFEIVAILFDIMFWFFACIILIPGAKEYKRLVTSNQQYCREIFILSRLICM